MRYLLAVLCLATPTLADTPLSGEAFEDLVQGKTLTFSNGFAPYGIEYYAPNRRVIWSFIDGDCVSGEWYEQAGDTGPNICFVYEDDPTPKCWQVFDEDGKIRATFVGAPGTTVLYEAVEAEPLVCAGVGS